MTKDFNSFWAEFQVLASELDHNKATLVNELKYKLTSLLFRAMTGGVSWPKDIHKYAKQFQEAYQDLKDIEIQTPAVNFAENQYNQKKNTSTNANAKTTNQSKRLANLVYSCPFSVAFNPTVATCPACSKAIRLTKEKTAKLQREDQCFHYKEIGDHQPQCSKEWWSMTAITNPNTALALINVSEVAVPQPGHVEAENI